MTIFDSAGIIRDSVYFVKMYDDGSCTIDIYKRGMYYASYAQGEWEELLIKGVAIVYI